MAAIAGAESIGNGEVSRKVLIVDVSDFENRKQEIAQQLHYAASEVGFFYIKGHGIPEKLIDRQFGNSKKFFDLDNDVKQKYTFNPETYVGWRSQDNLESVTGNRLWEQANFGRYGVGGYDAPKKEFLGEKWVDELGDDWRKETLEFEKASHNVALRVLRAFAIALGKPENYFAELHPFDAEDNPSILAANSYPALPENVEDLPPRLHAHADMDVLSLLYLRPGDIGLEIAPGKEVDEDPGLFEIGNIWNTVPVTREWTELDPIEGGIIVNIGDGLMFWTDGLYKSTYHRVRAPRPEDKKDARMSIPYFLNPKLNHGIQGPEKKYPAVTGYDLLAKTGAAYEARKNNPTKEWQRKAYTQAYDEERKRKEKNLTAQPQGVSVT